MAEFRPAWMSVSVMSTVMQQCMHGSAGVSLSHDHARLLNHPGRGTRAHGGGGGRGATAMSAGPADLGQSAHWEAVINDAVAAVDATGGAGAGATVLPNVGATLAALREGIASVDAELHKQVSPGCATPCRCACVRRMRNSPAPAWQQR